MLLRKLLALAATVVMVSNVNPGFANNYNSGPYYNDGCCSPCCDPCHCFEVYGDWLYWRTRKCALDYAVPAVSGSTPFDGHVCETCPDWDSGYRLGLFRPSCGCDFEFGIRYTHYGDQETSSKTFSPTNAGAISRTRISDNIAQTTDSALRFARGHYALDYDVIDLEVGYGFDLQSCADARVFGGFRYAEIDQKFNVIYAHDPDDFLGEGSVNAVDKLRTQVDTESYGLYLGGEIGYDTCLCNRDVHFYGNFAYGFLYSNISRFHHVQGTPGNEAPFTDAVILKDGCWKLLSNVDLAIGLEFDLCRICCVDWYFGVGYEFHQWINLPDFINFEAGDSPGEVHFDHANDNLGLDGLYLRLGALF